MNDCEVQTRSMVQTGLGNAALLARLAQNVPPAPVRNGSSKCTSTRVRGDDDVHYPYNKKQRVLRWL